MSTYKPIASQTLSSAAASVTFSNIPQTYTDLVLVVAMTTNNATDDSGTIRYNNDSAGNYSSTHLTGNGSVDSSGRNVNAGGVTLAYQKNSDGIIFNIAHIMNYSNTTTYKTTLVRINNTATFVQNNVNTWRNTGAINRIDISFGSTMTSGSTFNLYGIDASLSAQAKATGGTTIIRDSSYWYHVFTRSGTFTPTEALTADVLVIAGGGAGGAGHGGGSGGGGAGGLLGFTSQSISVAQTVTVGAGGAAQTSVNGGAVYVGNNGNNSQFGALTAAIAGGGGAATVTNPSNIQGNTGGSGGGTAQFNSTAFQSGGTPTSGQGFAGGAVQGPGYGRQGSGGGGAGAIGVDSTGSLGTGNVSTNGGIGATYNTSVGGTAGPYSFINDFASATSTGVLSSGNYYYAGGGGGASAYGAGAGGIGGGGAGFGASTTGTAISGTMNSGGGGGAASGDASGIYSFTSGSGGSGIVIVRYAV